MRARGTSYPVIMNQDNFSHLWNLVEDLQRDLRGLALRLASAKEEQGEHPVVGTPLHFRIGTTCLPAVCLSVSGNVDEEDVISLMAFTRGGEGLGPVAPALRRTDVLKGVGETLTWHWPDDKAAHAWKPPRPPED